MSKPSLRGISFGRDVAIYDNCVIDLKDYTRYIPDQNTQNKWIKAWERLGWWERNSSLCAGLINMVFSIVVNTLIISSYEIKPSPAVTTCSAMLFTFSGYILSLKGLELVIERIKKWMTMQAALWAQNTNLKAVCFELDMTMHSREHYVNQFNEVATEAVKLRAELRREKEISHGLRMALPEMLNPKRRTSMEE